MSEAHRVSARPRLVLVDDHATVRAGVRALLEREGAGDIVAEAASCAEALDRVAASTADVVLMDITMPGVDGIDTTRELCRRNPAQRVLMLTMHSSASHLKRARDAGALGYCAKSDSHSDLLAGLAAVFRGESYQSVSLPRGHDLATPEDRHSAGLTARQRQILELVARSNTSKEIARGLGISVKTVESHRTALMRTLGIHDLAGLVRYAIKIDLVAPDFEAHAP